MTIRDVIQDAEIGAVDDELRQADGATTDVLGALAKRVATLTQEVARANAAIGVLTQALIERGAVDGGELKKRFDQALAAAQATASLVACGRCRKQVPKRATQVTPQGVYCDDCYRALMSDED